MASRKLPSGVPVLWDASGTCQKATFHGASCLPVEVPLSLLGDQLRCQYHLPGSWHRDANETCCVSTTGCPACQVHTSLKNRRHTRTRTNGSSSCNVPSTLTDKTYLSNWQERHLQNPAQELPVGPRKMSLVPRGKKLLLVPFLVKCGPEPTHSLFSHSLFTY